jgi:hypothetical protein
MGNGRTLIPAILLVSAVTVALWLIASKRSPQSTSLSQLVVVEKGRPAGSTAAKLKTIAIPLVDFEDISVADAVNYLKAQSLAHDSGINEPRGVDIRIYDPRGLLSEMRIRELRLKATPLGKALDFLCEGRIRYAVDDEVVWVMATTDVSAFENRRSEK